MNVTNKISKEVLNILDYSKEIVKSNLAQANSSNLLQSLSEDQLKRVVDIVEHSLSQGFQKAMPAFQKTLDGIVTSSPKSETIRKKR